jgi:hypothetical protein
MRTIATGFLLGYVVVGLLIAPSLLWAMRVTPDYSTGVAMVLERTGVSGAIDLAGQELVVLQNQISEQVAADLDRLMLRHRQN